MDQRFRVDWIRCDGFGLCGDLVPDLIDLDEWRYPILQAGPVDASRLHEAQRAVDCCPMKALFLEPIGTDRPVEATAGRPGPAGRDIRVATPMPGLERTTRRDR